MSVIEKPSVTCSATSPRMIAAHSRAPRACTKNETTSSAIGEQRDDDPRRRCRGSRNPSSPTHACLPALDEGLVDDAALRDVG